jgi:hypothetical protein
VTQYKHAGHGQLVSLPGNLLECVFVNTTIAARDLAQGSVLTETEEAMHQAQAVMQGRDGGKK